jgi:hypothetical protein
VRLVADQNAVEAISASSSKLGMMTRKSRKCVSKKKRAASAAAAMMMMMNRKTSRPHCRRFRLILLSVSFLADICEVDCTRDLDRFSFGRLIAIIDLAVGKLSYL